MGAGGYRRLYDFLMGGVRARIGDVFRHGSHKNIGFLADHGHRAPQGGEGNVPNIMAVQLDITAFRVIEPGNKIDQSRFPGAGLADNAQHLPGLDMKADVLEHRLIRLVAEADPIQADIAF